MTMHPGLRETGRAIGRELTSLVLVGAMLAPIVAAAAGWPVHTPLDVPLAIHAALLASIGLVVFGLARTDDALSARRRRIGWLLVPPFAVAFAMVVNERANVFYTERLLVEGMTALFILHLAMGALRRRAHRRLDPCPVATAPPWRWRRGAEWRRRLRARCLPTTPGIRLADALIMTVGWLVLTSWVLIALEHRHPAGPLLLAAGAMEALAVLALIPDALAGSGSPAPWTASPNAGAAPDGPPALANDDSPAGSSFGSHVLRRPS